MKEYFADTKYALEVEADVVLPCALENQITEENVPVQGKVCNRRGQWTDNTRRGQGPGGTGNKLVPDVLANTGGVTVSYRMGAKPAELLLVRRRSQRKLEINMTQAFHDVYNMHVERDVDMRTALIWWPLTRLPRP